MMRYACFLHRPRPSLTVKLHVSLTLYNYLYAPALCPVPFLVPRELDAPRRRPTPQLHH